jgi:hypothetical protein
MKSSNFDLEELNCWNKNLDIGLDASECNLNSFLHETCLLAEFSCHLWKIISPSYDIVCLLKFGAFIEIWVRNPKTFILHQLDFVALDIQVGMAEGQHWQIATLKAAISMLFLILFSCLRCPERYGC